MAIVLHFILLVTAIATAVDGTIREAKTTMLRVDGNLVEIPLSPGGPYNTSGGPIIDDPRVINVHLVPHTHNDPGWLKTVDQYFAGTSNSIQNANVGLILDSVIAELQLDENRKFIYVEIAFFTRWWRRQSRATKRIVRQLVAEGRLLFINAGWVMNDEAATLYTDIIDQHTAGALKIATEFSTDASPRVGWQIDPFGHSSFQNKAFREMCFDGWLVGRADAQDMAIREATGALEMVYRTRKENGSHTVDNFDGIFMGLMHMYSPPTGFHFDLLASDPPVQDDPMVEDVNVMHRLDSLRHICLKQAKSYNPENGERGKSQNIILTMGMDFNYQQAKTWFQNLDKLIHYSKLVADQQLSNPRESSHILNVFYSNPKIYIKSRHAQYDGGVGLPIKNSDEDFFPYGDGEVEVVDVTKRTVDAVDGGHAYWTGYFTSRPNFKGMVRGAGRTYTAARQLVATAVHRAQQDQLQSLERMTDAVGIAQHHDAITGTEKQHVDDDYCKKLHEATEGVMESIVIPETMSRFGLPNGGGYCPLLNESICSWTEELSTDSSSVLMAVYNPLSHPITSVVSVPIAPPKQKAESPEADDSIESYSVQRSLMGSLNRHCKGMTVAVEKAVSKQGVKSWVTDDDHHRGTPTPTLYFTAEDVPPMGSAIYRITSGAKGKTAACPQEQQLSGQPSVSSATSVGNENYKLFYGGDEGSGRLYRFTLKNLKAGLEVRFNVILGYYNSSTGSGENIYGRPYQASGAYIFRPDCPEAPDVRSIRSCRPEVAITPTILMGQADDGSTLRVNIAQQSSEEGSAPALIGNLSLSIPPKESAVVISWDVAIDVGDGVGKEAVLLLDTDINNHDGDFLTDSNGREWVPRRVNYRKDWQLNVTDPVAMNYYPINSGLRISDQVGKGSNVRQLTLVPDRAHGGASLLPGQLEIMIHRRMLFDDGRGVGEALDEVDCGKSLCLPKLVTGETRLLLEPVRTSTTEEESHDNYREMAHQVRLPLLPIFAHDDPKNPPKADKWSSLGGLTACKPLPREIQILTLELLHANNTPKLYYEKACAHHRCALLRVAHTYAQEEGGSPIQLDLAGKGTLLKDFELGPGFEVTLNAGRDIKTAEEERLKWSVHGVQSRRPVHDEGSHRVDWASVELQPLQIRTFIVTLLL